MWKLIFRTVNTEKYHYLEGSSMTNNSEQEKFVCLTHFSFLNGRRKQWVLVGDNPDARLANFWFRTRVINNWPSQWHTRYKQGYIKFENGERFDLETNSIRGKRVFIFEDSHEVYIRYRRQILGKAIRDALDSIPPSDRMDAMRQIHEQTKAALPNRCFGLLQVQALLLALSVSQLENLEQIIGKSTDQPSGGPSRVAA